MGLGRRLVDRIVGDTNRTKPSNGTHCGACGHPYTDADPAKKVCWDGYGGTRGTHKVHLSHTTDPASGYYQAR
ncbi:hypothetical protein FF36_00166 [Frankia torreyi]|uniref:Uncharacterized protein n=1 Tax=Frankia torreyi TaxID=1856 RepID=A0A0D8BN59_9ACTN|nr:hypothetical protein [Frankia torreyi]KJE25550.1 hypothetical protein FF36_00166 [Frankia torreyi]KQM06194.1 hypothetical protein FF86_101071 [Frankia sp. CpI1-P]